MSLNDAWERIETWLDRHAPAARASLPGPALPAAVTATEAAIGRPVSDELRTSLARHDGSGEFVLPAFHRLSGAPLIAREYAAHLGAREHRPEYWNPAWIPFAYDESGNSLVISTADDEIRGRIGVHEKDGGGEFDPDPAFGSMTALLTAVATGLEEGTLSLWGAWHPYADEDGFLEWREPEDGQEIAWNMDGLNRRYGF
ncbi:SMI1/KNR4 family protein [Streptomyces sp. NBC_01410]|uniref:SMI1/KNR4 family protein n=1 Tax=Streptomyces sp. NBC_01410 TaxID=2903856 RepID=UPI00324761D7